MTEKVLAALMNTAYTVVTERDSDGDYVVNVYKPSRDPNQITELVASRYLPGTSDMNDLNALVSDVVQGDNALEGTYIGREGTTLHA